VDECGECGGDGIADGACDCAGTVPAENFDCDGDCLVDIDCSGECGGSAYEITLCEDTDGDGLGNPGTETIECVEGGRDVTDGCDLSGNSVFVTSDGSVLYNAVDAIGGFQFSLDGATASSASGGDAAASGFMVSTSGTTVIGFSLTGTLIGPDCGTLTNLSISGTPTSLSNLVFSDDIGGALNFTYHTPSETADMVANCSDEYPDCSANYTDCSGECGGSAVVDECGECGGDGIADGACDCAGTVPAENFDCDGDCLVDIDCSGECGGSAVLDECGVCNGDGIADGACDCAGTLPAENFDCDGDCIVDIDCSGECGGSAILDECGECGGDNSSCSGCIDSLALNYDMEATLSDGSCEYPVYGCLDTSALNYDSNATHSNGDCDYPPEVGLSFGSIDAVNGTIEVFGSSDKDLSEISFSLSGATITGASGGSTDNMTVSVSSNSFSASGDIDDGSSLLTILTFTDGLGEFCFTSGNITSPGYDTVNLTLGGCSVFVGADGGVVTSDAAGVDIPAGAMSESENISVGDVTEELSEEVDNATGFEVEEMTAFTPFDIVFEEPVEISISYDDSRNNRDGEFLCYLEDANDTEWAIVDGATCTDGECIADVDSFGIFATCILVEDCNGDLGGFSFLDDCGECVGGETGLESEYSMDACGLCGGPGMIDWYVDADSDNLGFGDGVSFCSDNVPSGYVPNDIDVEPNCATNDTDECDLCGGGGPDNGFDCDGNCVADGGYDCMGECGGSSQNDDCGVCGGDNASCTDCSGDINGSAYTDGCDSCVGGNTGDEACASDCNGVDGGTAWIDACGECVDAGDISCEQGCDGNWSNDNSELVNDDCGVCGGDNSSCTGCVDDEACNYVPDATIGDDSCSYSEENYDCVGNCAIEVDCMGECGGNSSEDECGICNGPGASIWYEDSDGDGLGDSDASISSCSIEDGYVPNDDDDEPDCATNDTDDCGVCSGGNIDQDCNGDCFGDAVVDECGDCGGEGIADGACDCDGNVEDCAGDCGGSALLDDCGVCNGGNADQDCSGECFGTAEVDDCGVCGGGNTEQDCNGDCFGSAYHDDCDVCVGGNTGLEECGDPFTAVEIDLHGGANLISLYALPDDRSVGNIMASLEGIVTGVIGEGVAASPNPVLGWVGSLSEFEETSGYWVKVNADATLMVEDATPLDPSLEYNLHSGANLISFPYEGSVGIAEGLPDDMEGFVTGIIGEGVAASPNPVLGWVGSLTAFQGTKGYWMKMSADASFSFNIPDGLIRSSIPVEIQKSPIGVDFDQSTQQAFYFVEDIVLDGEPIQNGDWVMAYNGNVLVGAREWNGAYTDIPVMGYDSHIATAGYLENGETPTFKVIRETTGETFVLSGNLPVWTNNELYTVGVMENVVFPSTIVLNEAYPNPFNPSTNIEFGLSDDADVNVTVYDIAGREMAVLAQGQFSKGFHNVIWNAADQPSGIYFVTVSTQSETQTQKLMLIK
ncbi:MAG: T9SS type A sorting domain-containing protein, partial [Candidatus Marinimicrobia bacterium]|nr:T9SS type A sorting domain-containing protein [Candidatus Neomarinimicrobiota bacterium]